MEQLGPVQACNGIALPFFTCNINKVAITYIVLFELEVISDGNSILCTFLVLQQALDCKCLWKLQV